MNAQEAIEITNKELYVLKNTYDAMERHAEKLISLGMYDNETLQERLDKLEEKIEALSIVLESAKLFHQHIIPKFQEDYKKLGMKTEAESVFGVPLESVGIKEGESE